MLLWVDSCGKNEITVVSRAMYGALVTHKHELVLVWFSLPAGPGVEAKHSAAIESMPDSAHTDVNVTLRCKLHGRFWTQGTYLEVHMSGQCLQH